MQTRKAALSKSILSQLDSLIMLGSGADSALAQVVLTEVVSDGATAEVFGFAQLLDHFRGKPAPNGGEARKLTHRRR